MTDTINVVDIFIPDHYTSHLDLKDSDIKSFILKKLKGDLHSALHSSNLNGRPGTLTVTADNYFIKLHSKLKIEQEDCLDYLLKITKKERELAIHHPDKVWFYLLLNNNKTLIGNITPYLISLDNLADKHKDILFQQIFNSISLYLKCLARMNTRLDLSLSNFALSTDLSTLYYLDDETYSWDDFNQLSDFLSYLIRSGHLIDETKIKNLGQFIYQQLEIYYPENHYNIQIIHSLKNSFFSSEKHYALLALTSAMYDTRDIQLDTNNSTRMAIIADIHANAPALKQVLEFLDKKNIEDILVLGDIVGYGPHPNECVEILRQYPRLRIICGNHDHAAYAPKEEITAGTSRHASWALNWTRNTINNDTSNWLAQLPMFIREANWLAVHGAPIDKHYFNAYVYQMSYSSNLDVLTQRNIPICFHGHTHVQKVYYRMNGKDFGSKSDTLTINHFQHSLICPGSVGQPRCGKPGAELALIDFTDYTVQFHRLDYDIKSTLNDMKKARFPSVLIERLEAGY